MRSTIGDTERLLVDRAKAARILGVCRSTIIRLEKASILKRVRLNTKAKHSKAYYRLGDVVSLVDADRDARNGSAS